MSPEYWLTHLKLQMRAKQGELRERPYELITQQSDSILNHFAVGHGMQPMKEGNCYGR